MSKLDSLVQLLRLALQEPLRRKERIVAFKSTVWKGLEDDFPPVAAEILRDLAFDLEFFEPDKTARAQSASYYGHKRAEQEIQDALSKLRAMGLTRDTDM